MLTTHYLDEAQALADRVAILQDGLILAEGPPRLARRRRATGSPGAPATARSSERFTEDPTALLHELTAEALARGERLEELSVTRPSLEDVYLELTRGRRVTAAVPWWRAAWRQFRLERRMFWRNPSAAFFGVLLPLGLLAIFGAVFAGRQEDLDVIVPGIAGLSVMSATFISLAYNLTTCASAGILKRLRGTPLPTSAYLAGAGRQRGRQRRRCSS